MCSIKGCTFGSREIVREGGGIKAQKEELIGVIYNQEELIGIKLSQLEN